MSGVGGIGSSGGTASNTPRSSIGGVGTGSTTDTSSASITQIRGRILETFRQSALRFPSVISNVLTLKDQLESADSTVNKLYSLTQSAKDEMLSDSDRLRLNNEFQRGLRELQGIIKNSEENGVNISKADSFTKAMRVADIKLDYNLEFPSVLRNVTVDSSTQSSSSSIYSQRIDTLENAESAEIVLERTKRALKNDIRGIDNAVDSLDKAYKLSAAAYNGMLEMFFSGVSDFDQLARKVRSEIRGKTSDFLIGTNGGLDKDLVDSVLRR